MHFAVTALMTHVALDTYWVTLARAHGTTTRLGVTSEHPMLRVSKGWLPAGEVGAGDKIFDSALGELSVGSHTAVLLTPAIECLFRYLNLPDCINARNSLAAQHLNLPRLRDNLFRLVAFDSHI